MKRTILLLVATSASFVGAAVAGGQSVSACSCATFTDQEAFDRADVVFTGALVEVVTPSGEMHASTDAERFVFDVEQVYKGEAVDPQTVVTARDGASCGLEIQGRGPFLVYATSTDSIVTGAVDRERYSNLCSGTRAVADAALPAGFGVGRAPTPLAAAGDDGPNDERARSERPREAATSAPDGGDMFEVPWTVVAVGGIVAAGLVAGLIALYRRAAREART